MIDPASDEGRRLVRRMAGAFARARPRDPLCEADDLAQEAALSLHRRLGGRPAGPGLVVSVARQAFADAWARATAERAREAAAMEAAAWRADRPALDPSEALDVRLAVESLGPLDTALLVGAYRDGSTAAELGAAAGRGVHWALRRTAEARGAVAARLGADYAEDFGRKVARRGHAEPRVRVRPAGRTPPRAYDAERERGWRLARRARLATAAGDRRELLIKGACA